MVKRNSRRSGGIFGRLYSPVHQAFGFGSNAVGAVTNTTRNVARRGLRGVNSVGRSATSRANKAVSGLFSRRRRGGGKNRSTRNRRNRSERNRRNRSERNRRN